MANVEANYVAEMAEIVWAKLLFQKLAPKKEKNESRWLLLMCEYCLAAANFKNVEVWAVLIIDAALMAYAEVSTA